MELDIEKILESEQAWEYVLLDIVKSEELDPWDIDLTKLTQKYMEKIKKMEELDLRVPARLILTAAILLRLQSEQLMPVEEEADWDADLFDIGELPGAEPEDVPLLDLRVRRKPTRRVTLGDLISTLKKSMEPKPKREKIPHFVMEFPEVDITEQIEELYRKILGEHADKMPFKNLVPENTIDGVVDTLIPLLHLANEQKILLDQEKFFDEIFVSIAKGAK